MNPFFVFDGTERRRASESLRPARIQAEASPGADRYGPRAKRQLLGTRSRRLR